MLLLCYCDKKRKRLEHNMDQKQIVFRIAENEDAQRIHALMLEVYEQMEDKTLYVCDDLAFVERHISNEGFIVAACAEDVIVGSLILRIPDESDNLGRDIGLSDQECQRVMHVESAVVLPEYRGKALQKRMLQFAQNHIDKNAYSYLMATVSPKNPASCRTLEQSGYTCVLTKQKYGGLLRRIYIKNLCNMVQ